MNLSVPPIGAFNQQTFAVLKYRRRRYRPPQMPPVDVPAAVPADPFAQEYKIPEEREVGTAAGQFRIIGAGCIGVGREGPEYGLQGTLELMTFPYLGIRATGEASVLRPPNAPDALIGKMGPSLHILPYHRVDLSIFFEGGFASINPYDSYRTLMPIFSPGGTLEIWLSSSWLLRGETHLDWGIYGDDHGAAHGYLRLVFTGGLGFAI